MKLGTKIVAAAISAVALSVVVGLFAQRAVIKSQGIEANHDTMRAVIAQAESSWASMRELDQAGAFDEKKLLADAEKAADIHDTTFYRTIPVVSAWLALDKYAKEAGWTLRVPKHQPRNPKNEPTPEESAILAKFEKEGLKEYTFADESTNTILYAKPIVLTSDCLKCHGDPATSPTKDGRDLLGFKMENWKAGEVHGAFILKHDFEDIHATMSHATWQTLL